VEDDWIELEIERKRVLRANELERKRIEEERVRVLESLDERQNNILLRRILLRKKMGLLRTREKSLFVREFESLERLESFERGEQQAASAVDTVSDPDAAVAPESSEPPDPALFLLEPPSSWLVDGFPSDWSFDRLSTSSDVTIDKPVPTLEHS
jgi:hypothetical protein